MTKTEVSYIATVKPDRMVRKQAYIWGCEVLYRYYMALWSSVEFSPDLA
jgi:hypothetical protein